MRAILGSIGTGIEFIQAKHDIKPLIVENSRGKVLVWCFQYQHVSPEHSSQRFPPRTRLPKLRKPNVLLVEMCNFSEEHASECLFSGTMRFISCAEDGTPVSQSGQHGSAQLTPSKDNPLCSCPDDICLTDLSFGGLTRPDTCPVHDLVCKQIFSETGFMLAWDRNSHEPWAVMSFTHITDASYRSFLSLPLTFDGMGRQLAMGLPAPVFAAPSRKCPEI